MSATLTVTEAAALLGISRNTAYEVVRRDGALAGIAIIRVGPRRLLIPRTPFFAVLGVEVTAAEDDGSE